MAEDTAPLERKRKAFLARLGAHIAAIRQAKHYSQDRLYLEAGLSRSTLSRIERGLVDPQVSTLMQIADTLGVPLKKLLDF
jgi:transcriptional regulator with XRE-family HTH domain